jgi:histidinol phosphatase-like enzyme
MLFRGAADHALDLAQCWMIGDAASDIAAGKSAGCKTALVTDTQDYLCWAEQPDLAGKSLASLAEQITTASIAL